MTGTRVPLAAIKAAICPGRVFDVTSHHITREDHPAFGTTRRRVTRTTSSRFYVTSEQHARAAGSTAGCRDGGCETPIDWPRVAQVQRDPDGTIRLYGGPGQDPDDLYLTLIPVNNGVPVRCPDCTDPEHGQCGSDPACHCCQDAASRREGDAR